MLGVRNMLDGQVDGGGWESQVLLDDSQKLRKPKLPVYLDDPDMLFCALHTPKPMLRVLQTEAQQENVRDKNTFLILFCCLSWPVILAVWRYTAVWWCGVVCWSVEWTGERSGGRERQYGGTQSAGCPLAHSYTVPCLLSTFSLEIPQ